MCMAYCHAKAANSMYQYFFFFHFYFTVNGDNSVPFQIADASSVRGSILFQKINVRSEIQCSTICSSDAPTFIFMVWYSETPNLCVCYDGWWQQTVNLPQNPEVLHYVYEGTCIL